MQHHPDRNLGKEEWANEKVKEINEAYGVLGDPQKRRQYDQFGTVGNIGDVFNSSFTRATFEDLIRDFGGAGLRFDFPGDVFGDLFGGRGFSFKIFGSGFGPTGARFESPTRIDLDEILRQPQRPQHQNARYEITITKDQAERGLGKELARRGRKLRVKIPAGIKSRTEVRLKNARQVTDGSQEIF